MAVAFPASFALGFGDLALRCKLAEGGGSHVSGAFINVYNH